MSTLDQTRGVARVTGGEGKGYESVSLQILSHMLAEEYKVDVSRERQFNVEEMLNSQTPIYYPMKIMEYVYGTVSTMNIREYVYENMQVVVVGITTLKTTSDRIYVISLIKG